MAKIDKDYFNVNEGIKANSVDDVLEPNEEVLLRLVPDKRDYVLESIFKGLPVALIWGGFDVFFIIMLVNSGALKEAGWLALFIIGFFAIHLFPLWAYIAQIVRRVAGFKNIEYVFTDHRLIVRSGLIGIDFKFFFYTGIESVTVKVGIWDRLFKVGDIYVKDQLQTAVLEDIHNPYAYSAKLQGIIQDIKADVAYPNDLRPKENHGYETKYKGKNRD